MYASSVTGIVVVATTFRGKLHAFFGNFTPGHISKFSLKQTTRARAPPFRHVSSLLFPPFGHQTSALALLFAPRDRSLYQISRYRVSPEGLAALYELRRRAPADETYLLLLNFIV